jgi:hypothetical protein
LALKNPPKKTHPKKPKKTHLKKPTKNGVFWVFWVFFKFFIFYENNTNFSLSNIFFYEQISNKLSFIYQKIVRYALN